MDINVIYEDENLIVINKPAGLLVHSAPGREEETLVDWLGINFPEIQDKIRKLTDEQSDYLGVDPKGPYKRKEYRY